MTDHHDHSEDAEGRVIDYDNNDIWTDAACTESKLP